MSKRISIIGAGNIGTAIAGGLASSSGFSANSITLTRRRLPLLEPWAEKGFNITSDNNEAVSGSDIVIIAVEPQQMDDVLAEINPSLDPKKHVLISVVSAVSIRQIRRITGEELPVTRAMPNTAISIGQSMTCICAGTGDTKALELTKSIFDTVGKTIVIMEEQMTAATALCACGIAFFLRSIRAASQGGTEIGFHAHEALEMAAQTAKGAASLLSNRENHPEFEIDRVTTPRGCTISGLNEMEHGGFSSAMIKGILVSATKAEKLYEESNGEG